MPLPPGFELEQAAPLQQSAGMKLPPGFEMETSSGVPVLVGHGRMCLAKPWQT